MSDWADRIEEEREWWKDGMVELWNSGMMDLIFKITPVSIAILKKAKKGRKLWSEGILIGGLSSEGYGKMPLLFMF